LESFPLSYTGNPSNDRIFALPKVATGFAEITAKGVVETILP